MPAFPRDSPASEMNGSPTDMDESTDLEEGAPGYCESFVISLDDSTDHEDASLNSEGLPIPEQLQSEGVQSPRLDESVARKLTLESTETAEDEEESAPPLRRLSAPRDSDLSEGSHSWRVGVVNALKVSPHFPAKVKARARRCSFSKTTDANHTKRADIRDSFTRRSEARRSEGRRSSLSVAELSLGLLRNTRRGTAALHDGLESVGSNLRKTPPGIVLLLLLLCFWPGVAYLFHVFEGWSGWESFLFTLSVSTTVGYGNITPETSEGKVLVICGGIVGIPLVLAVVKWLGNACLKVVDAGLLFAMKRVRRIGRRIGFVRRKGRRQRWMVGKRLGARKRHQLLRVFTCALLYLIFYLHSVFVYSAMEGWSTLDAMYYTFVTFSTIGLGDLVPLSKYNNIPPLTWYHIWHVFVFMFGLTLLSMLFTVLTESVGEVSTAAGNAVHVGLNRMRTSYAHCSMRRGQRQHSDSTDQSCRTQESGSVRSARWEEPSSTFRDKSLRSSMKRLQHVRLMTPPKMRRGASLPELTKRA
mmetsp:Transcript_22043/g.46673  ORF Transcript_22043/g.46673 Transcript_22043/m.46673 type:complete len:529 (-) Transcript_22043:216-1802(-)